MKKLNKFSKTVTQDPTQPAAQAMLHGIGLTKEDFEKPIIGIASTGYEGNPCNMHLNDLAKYAKQGTQNEDVVGLIFNTIGVSDGISMGTPGMRYSLPSRDVIADSMETVVQAMSYDGLITVVGCDKNMPGALMAMIRLNRPSILIYGGTIDSGCHNGKKFQAQEPVVACTLQILWHQLSKHWECRCLIIRPIRQLERRKRKNPLKQVKRCVFCLKKILNRQI